jgi:hypothetical protein
MAVDVYDNAIHADVGCGGHIPDGGVLKHTGFCKKVEQNSLELLINNNNNNNTDFIYVWRLAIVIRRTMIGKVLLIQIMQRIMNRKDGHQSQR